MTGRGLYLDSDFNSVFWHTSSVQYTQHIPRHHVAYQYTQHIPNVQYIQIHANKYQYLHMKCQYVQIHTNTCNIYQKQYTPINASTYHNTYHSVCQYKPWSPTHTNMHTVLHWCTWHDLKWPDLKRCWPFGVLTIYDQTIYKKREKSFSMWFLVPCQHCCEQSLLLLRPIIRLSSSELITEGALQVKSLTKSAQQDLYVITICHFKQSCPRWNTNTTLPADCTELAHRCHRRHGTMWRILLAS